MLHKSLKLIVKIVKLVEQTKKSVQYKILMYIN